MLSGERGGDASKGADIFEQLGLFAFGHGICGRPDIAVARLMSVGYEAWGVSISA